MHAIPQPPLKIGFFHSTLPEPGRKPGGVEIFVHRLANRLAEQDYDVTVFTYSSPPDDASYRVVKIGPSWLGLQRVARFALAPLLINRLPQTQLDVLHLHGDDWFLLSRQVPTVRTIYGSALLEARTATTTRRRVEQAIVYPLEILASRLATASFDIGSSLPSGYSVDGSLTLAVNETRSSCASQPRKRPTVLFVGTWHGRKRGAFLADTFERDVLPHHPTAELVMVSDDCVERTGVRWIRVPSDDELSDLYASAWIFCLPSTYEGFGMPYLEACAHGLPVVASPNAGARYVLAGGCGVMVDDADLGETLSGLLSDPGARAQLGAAGLQRAHDFSWSRVLKEHEQAYALAAARFARNEEASARRHRAAPINVGELDGQKHWDRFARDDPDFYIASHRNHWTEAEFYANGAEILAQYDKWLAPLDSERAVEIGSGLGRITVHLATRFTSVHATDISNEMVHKAQQRQLPANIQWTVTTSRMPVDDHSTDLVFSYNVMQHIPSRCAILRYLREIRRVLKPSGRAIVQYDSAPRPLWQRTAQRFPDRLLPRTQRRFIRRYPIPADQLEAMIDATGLAIIDQSGRHTKEHDVLLGHAVD